MRIRTISMALAAAAIMVLGVAGTGFAFHDGGVGSCGSCHTMHNSLGGVVDSYNRLPTLGTSGTYLLRANDQSSTCLNCHGAGSTLSGYHVYTALTDFLAGVPAQHTPGGEFTWLKVGTTTSTDTKSMKGHSIIASDFGLDHDTRAGMSTAPGGTYPNGTGVANSFHCSSCHDPHGKFRVLADGSFATTGKPIAGSGSYSDNVAPTADEAVGSYRILAGIGYKPKSISDASLAFTADPPVAIAPKTYNVVTGDAMVAYGSGMSEWCANCHTNLHNDAYPTNLRHPAGNGAKLTSAIVANYNAYKKSGDLTNTDMAAAYWPLVPFERGLGNGDRAALTTLAAAPTEATTSNNVMCLSCHRAHGSGFNSMLRWNNTLMVVGGVYAAPSGGYVQAQTDGAYYGYAASNFAAEQRSLCNKCHAKD